MDTSIGLIKQRSWWQNPSLHLGIIHKMQKTLEIPQEDEGFDELIVVES